MVQPQNLLCLSSTIPRGHHSRSDPSGPAGHVCEVDATCLNPRPATSWSYSWGSTLLHAPPLQFLENGQRLSQIQNWPDFFSLKIFVYFNDTWENLIHTILWQMDTNILMLLSYFNVVTDFESKSKIIWASKRNNIFCEEKKRINALFNCEYPLRHYRDASHSFWQIWNDPTKMSQSRKRFSQGISF